MLSFMKIGDSLMSFRKFSHMFQDVSSTDCHSSTPIQKKLCQMDEEVKEIVIDLLKGLVADLYDEIIKLVQGLDKCLNRNRRYVEK
jgi:hypothetical protein